MLVEIGYSVVLGSCLSDVCCLPGVFGSKQNLGRMSKVYMVTIELCVRNI